MKAGLEIHQQLDTKHKLFCGCPTELYDNFSKQIIRKLHVTASELGTVDVAAQYEFKKGKYYVYQFSNDYACLVELDEEPPHLINIEALKIAILIAEVLNMQVLDAIQVMRKIVIDGSNTTGFQRTALIATNGKIIVNNKEITIQTLCIEEDAARKIEDKEKYIVYRLDRLGIPLVEITTGPDINTPEDVKAVAEYIGLLLRLTNKVKRGLGTIRQDINLSIPGGNKVEIKGVQKLELIPNIVKNEITRQKKLLEWANIVKSKQIEGVVLEV